MAEEESKKTEKDKGLSFTVPWLMAMAEEQLADPSLAAWAAEGPGTPLALNIKADGLALAVRAAAAEAGGALELCARAPEEARP